MTSAGGALALPIAPLPVTALANAGAAIALPSALAAELALQPGQLIKGRVVMRDGLMRLLLDGAAGQILKLPANSDATPGAVWQLKAIRTTQGWQLLRAAAEALSPLAGFKPRPASLAPQLLSIAGGSLRNATPAPALWPQPLDVEWVAAALQTRPQTRLHALPTTDAAVAVASRLALAPRASPGDAHAAPPATNSKRPSAAFLIISLSRFIFCPIKRSGRPIYALLHRESLQKELTTTCILLLPHSGRQPRAHQDRLR